MDSPKEMDKSQSEHIPANHEVILVARCLSIGLHIIFHLYMKGKNESTQHCLIPLTGNEFCKFIKGSRQRTVTAHF